MSDRRFAVVVGAVVSVFAGCSTQELTADSPAAVWSVGYTSSGELGVFTTHELVIYDHTLAEERARVAYPGVPAGAYLEATDLSADGRVAVVAWSNQPFEIYSDSAGLRTPPATVVAFRVPGGEVLSTLAYDGGLIYGFGPGPGPAGQLPTIRLSPDGDLLLAESYADAPWGFHVRKVDGGEILWGSNDISPPFLFSADGALVYGFGALDAATQGLMAWDARSGEIAQRMGGWLSHALAGSADGRWLVGSQAHDTNPTAFSLWRTDNGSSTLPFREAPDCYALDPMAMSPDGGRWATLAQNVGQEGPIRWAVHLWTQAGSLLLDVPTTYRSFQSFSPDGTELAVGPLGPDGATLNVYQTSDGALVQSRAIADSP
jgi:hypothetical protein